jgi:hypothetical protein
VEHSPAQVDRLDCQVEPCDDPTADRIEQSAAFAFVERSVVDLHPTVTGPLSVLLARHGHPGAVGDDRMATCVHDDHPDRQEIEDVPERLTT